MKTIRRMMVACVGLGLLMGPAVAWSAGPGSPFATDSKIVHFKLSGKLLERPMDETLFMFGGEKPVSLQELVQRMQKARDDDTVKAVLLSFESPQLGLGQLEELRQAIEQIKPSKDVYIHSDDYLSTGLYCLACSGSHLSVVPTGDVWLLGLYGESPYLRGLLDKIGVTPDFLQIAEYKSAAEILTRTGPSPQAQEQIDWLVNDMFDSMVSMIADSRDLPKEKVLGLIDKGLLTAEEAKEAGLIDSVVYYQDLVANLKERYGADVKIVRKYGEERGPEFKMDSVLDVINLLSELFHGAAKPTKTAVGVVYVDGPILTGSEQPNPFGPSGYAYSTTIRKALDKAARDDSIKAVVLRVDSPGGSALASEIIWNAGQRVQAEKPFVVSMGNVAGSGGYYVSCGAKTIFADATTITASIGVVGGKLVTTDMWNKLGVTWHPTKRGKNADLMNTSQTFTEEQHDKLFDWMNHIYQVFTGHVTAARGEKLTKPLDEIAGGRVFTGKQALALGLVDKLGTMDDAIKYAAAQAQISDYEVRVLPEPKTVFDLLMEGFGGEKEEETALDRGPTRYDTLLGRESPWLSTVLPILAQLDPQRAEALMTALTRLQLIHDEGVVLMMPFEIVIH
jgi:protease-4